MNEELENALSSDLGMPYRDFIESPTENSHKIEQEAGLDRKNPNHYDTRFRINGSIVRVPSVKKSKKSEKTRKTASRVTTPHTL